MVKANHYLLVNNGKKAIKHYETLFKAKMVEHQPYSKEMGKEFGFPDNFDYENSTMHAELNILDTVVYLSDNMTGSAPASSGNVEVVLELDSKDQIDAIYNKAKELDSKIIMEL